MRTDYFAALRVHDEPIKQSPFWLVWRRGGGAPTAMHETRESATMEAERLALRNPGQSFVVMESVEAITFGAITRVNLRPNQPDLRTFYDTP